MKRHIDLARQMIDKPNGSGLILLNRILNGGTKVSNSGMSIDLNNLKEIMNDLQIDSIPELEDMLSQEKNILIDYLEKARNTKHPLNGRKSMYYNHILGDLGRKRK